MNTIACPHCAAPNRPQAVFCVNCGRKLVVDSNTQNSLNAASSMRIFMPHVPTPNLQLNFCTRCGNKVEPYQPSSISLRDFFEYQIDPPEYLEGESSYWCSQCNKRWLATNMADTGRGCTTCETFMPIYTDFCGGCGTPLRSKNQKS